MATQIDQPNLFYVKFLFPLVQQDRFWMMSSGTTNTTLFLIQANQTMQNILQRYQQVYNQVEKC